MQYTQDYDEKIPWQNAATDGAKLDFMTNPPNIFLDIQPYLKSTQLLVCPSSTADLVDGPGYTPTTAGNSSYLPNGVISTTLSGEARSLASIPETATTIMMQEWKYYSAASILRPTYAGASKYIYWLYNTNFSYSHFDGGNLLFCDGHVKFKKQEAICAAEFGLTPDTGAACGANTGLATGNL
jgi:prepilin-type processing-associated H-X9-DG protein